MKSIAIITVSAAALALAGCGPKATTATEITTNSVAVDTGNDVATAGPSVSAGQVFANDAASSDAFEIATSQLALTNSSSAAIKGFAQKMMDAHSASTAKLKTAASGATPPLAPDPTLTAEQQTKLAALKTMSGKMFDQAYVAAQVEGHQITLDKLRAYASSGEVPALKSFATSLVPAVTAHLNMAKALKV